MARSTVCSRRLALFSAPWSHPLCRRSWTHGRRPMKPASDAVRGRIPCQCCAGSRPPSKRRRNSAPRWLRHSWRPLRNSPGASRTRSGSVPADFLDRYGWTELLGRRGPFASERIACGFLLLGPATAYPRHRHEAEEWYLPLTGAARWRQGDGIWRTRLPGTLIVHRSEEPHAMRTGASPLLALYCWRSEDIGQKPRLDPPASPT